MRKSMGKTPMSELLQKLTRSCFADRDALDVARTQAALWQTWHPDARPVSPADEIRRIAPLLDALSDQMHRVSIDSFQPETQRYALKRGVGYLNDIQGFPDPALYPDIAEADCRLVVMHSAQRDGIATRTGQF